MSPLTKIYFFQKVDSRRLKLYLDHFAPWKYFDMYKVILLCYLSSWKASNVTQLPLVLPRLYFLRIVIGETYNGRIALLFVNLYVRSYKILVLNIF